MDEELLAGILSSYKGKQRELMPILQDIQGSFGYLPEETMVRVAKFTGVPESQLYSVASFYTQFRLTPLGRNRVSICRGTACHIRGAPKILEETEKALGIKESETSSDMEYTLETVACIGCCALAPCISVNGEVHGEMSLNDVKGMFSDAEGRD